MNENLKNVISACYNERVKKYIRGEYMAEEAKIDIQDVVNRYNNLLGEYNKQRKMIDKMAIKVAQHTVEITERDVVIETLKSMIPTEELPAAEAAVEAAVSEAVSEEE